MIVIVIYIQILLDILGGLIDLMRENNSGWRIDYFVVSNRIKDLIKEVNLRNDIFGSDHCPVEIDIEL